MEIAILVIAVIAHFAIGFFTYFHNRKSYTNRFFLSFTIIAAIWGVNQYFSLHQDTSEKALNVIRWAMVLAALYSFSLYLTVYNFPSTKLMLSKRRLIALSSLTAIVCILSRTPLIFASATGTGAEAEPVPGPLIFVFALTAGFFIGGAIYLLITRHHRAAGVYRAQLLYLIIGVVGSALLLFVTNFALVVLFDITSLIILGPTYTLVFIGATAYAIVAHHLFDIRVIIKKTIVYSALLLVILGSYTMVVFFFSTLFGFGSVRITDYRVFSANLLAALLISAGYDPLRRWFQRITDRYLFKGEYDAQDVAAKLAKMLSNVINLDEALDSMMSVVTKEMRISKVATLVIRTIDKDTVIKSIQSTGYSNVQKLEDYKSGAILDYFAKYPTYVVAQEVKRKLEQSENVGSLVQQLLVQLEQFQAAIALPLIVSGKMIGVLLVGDKLSGDSFSNDDLDTLGLIGSQTAVSIEKAQFYEEDKLKSEFISVASHELLTPTAAIEGYLSMLLDPKMKLTADQRQQYTQRSYDSSRRLADLVKDLLSTSRIESGKIKIVATPMDIVATIDEAIEELKMLAKEKNLTLEWAHPAKALPKVLADHDRVMQVIINLTNNAIKYTPRGTVTVTAQQKGTEVLIEVTDTGIGIAKEDQKHLFEKFHRIDNAATAGIMGTGLGLYIVKNIVQLLGGKIGMSSTEGKGSIFWFTLPIAK